MAKKSGKKIFRIALGMLLVAGIGTAWLLYQAVYKANILNGEKKSKVLFIPSGSAYEELLEILYDEHIVDNHNSFEWLAKRMKLSEAVHPGRYRILAGMSNRELINLLKSGKQEKVKLTFNAVDRTLENIITDVSEKLEIDREELEDYLNNEGVLKEKYGLNKENIRTLFIPGTYELNWTTHLEEFFQLMQSEYKKFWTPQRKELAKKMNYSQSEVMILASIVQCESGIKSEQQKIAGVYINRMTKNMPLQADPTLIFASGSFTIRRVRNGDKDIDSPYNTYRNKGLPPGPICLPNAQAIDAVLNYEHSKYLYFCAKPDLSGYSNYAETYAQHCKFADAYQNEMDKRGIHR